MDWHINYLGANLKNLKCTPRIWRKPKKAPQRMILANLKPSRFARDLKGDWIKNVHKCPSNKSPQEVRLKSWLNVKNENSPENSSKNREKEKRSGAQDWTRIWSFDYSARSGYKPLLSKHKAKMAKRSNQRFTLPLSQTLALTRQIKGPPNERYAKRYA